MDATALRDRFLREDRLDVDLFHLFALDGMVEALRAEPEYERNGYTGLTLLKTDHLRVVLEVARAGSRIGEHVVAGPTVVHVLSGSLRAACDDETRVAHAGEMIVVPHDRAREIHTDAESAFLWVLALAGSDGS